MKICRCFFSALCIFCCASSRISAESIYNTVQWGSNLETAVPFYCGTSFIEVNLASVKYENRIYLLILSLSPEIKNRLSVIRSKTSPERDLLFLDKKLISIVEKRESVDENSFKTIFLDLKNSFGIPSMTRDEEYSLYSCSNESTNALLAVKKCGSGYSTSLYLYSKSLMRILFSTD